MARIFSTSDAERGQLMGLLGEAIRRMTEGSVPHEIMDQALRSVAFWKLPCVVRPLVPGYGSRLLDGHPDLYATPNGVIYQSGGSIMLSEWNRPDPCILCSVRDLIEASKQFCVIPKNDGVVVAEEGRIVFCREHLDIRLYDGPGAVHNAYDHPDGVALVTDQDVLILTLDAVNRYEFRRVDPHEGSTWKSSATWLVEQDGGVFHCYGRRGIYHSLVIGHVDFWQPHARGIVFRRERSFFLVRPEDLSQVELFTGDFSPLWDRRHQKEVDFLCLPQGIIINARWEGGCALLYCDKNGQRPIVTGEHFLGTAEVDVDPNGYVVYKRDGLHRVIPGQEPELLFPPYGQYSFIAHPRGAVINIARGLWLAEPKLPAGAPVSATEPPAPQPA